MNKAAVLIGGTFNPVTIAHMAMGEYISSLYPDADIWYVPSNLDFMTRWKIITEEDRKLSAIRMEMLNAAISGHKNMYVSTIEADHAVSGKTYETVQYFLNEGYEDVSIAMGADKIYELEYWFNAKELIETSRIILFHRDDLAIDFDKSEFLSKYKDRFTVVSSPVNRGISSTAIREAVREGKLEEVKDLLPVNTWKYLQQLQL